MALYIAQMFTMFFFFKNKIGFQVKKAKAAIFIGE